MVITLIIVTILLLLSSIHLTVLYFRKEEEISALAWRVKELNLDLSHKDIMHAKEVERLTLERLVSVEEKEMELRSTRSVLEMLLNSGMEEDSSISLPQAKRLFMDVPTKT